MVSDDSDSSDAVDDFAETSTLLGYASKEPTDDIFSRLGGHPTWLDGDTEPSGHLATCGVCNDLLSLFLQLNGDLPERFPGHERRLYLFGCRKKSCRRREASIRGVRGTRISNSMAAAASSSPAPPPDRKPAVNVGNLLFGGSSSTGNSNANPFSLGPSIPFSTSQSSSSPPANPFSSTAALGAKPAQKPDTESLPTTFASKARISESQPVDPSFRPAPPASPPKPWPATSAFPPPYPSSFLDADYETLDKPKDGPKPATKGTLEDAEMGGTGPSSAAEDAKLFESSMDRTFQRFADRIAQNPEQVLRYEFDGAPLLYSATDAVGKRLAPEHTTAVASSGRKGVPRCGNCGAERVFELQLMPHAIEVLEEEGMGLDGMDWGTVILAVCERDCVPVGVEGKVGYTEEWVGVQWEELEVRKK